MGLRYIVKLAPFYPSLVEDVLKQRPDFEAFLSRQWRLRPPFVGWMGKVVEESFSEILREVSVPVPLSLSDLMAIPRIRVFTSISESKMLKCDSDLVLRQEALRRIHTFFDEHKRIYTDGSRDPVSGRAACSFYVAGDMKAGFRLADGTSIFIAELWGSFWQPIMLKLYIQINL